MKAKGRVSTKAFGLLSMILSFSLRPIIGYSSRWRTGLVGLSASFTSNADSPTNAAAIAVLSKRGKTWKRLRHMVDLATSGEARRVADVGCDHGLLTFGLALSGKFEKVIGSDVSQEALDKGARALHKEIGERLASDWQYDQLNDVEFRIGNGLCVLDKGEIDVVCIAGMGVHSMINILRPGQLERVGCNHLVLQATNARPRNLILLYEHLQQMGWAVERETIEMLSSRFYITASFRLAPNDGQMTKHLPASSLVTLPEGHPMRRTYDDYVSHHQRWLKGDANRNRPLHPTDMLWLSAMEKRNP